MVARKKTAAKKVAAKKTASVAQGNEVVSWDAKMAEEAEIAAGLEKSTGGGQFFSLSGGVLSWQDAPMPNNEMAVIVLDSMFENVYYPERYNADHVTPPLCFAFAKAEEDLEPHESVVALGQHQSTTGCEGCEHNQWGSADTGKGKACRNTRRLAVLSAGTFNRDGDLELFEEEDFKGGQIGFLKLPVMSVKGYATFVKQVAATMKRPLYGIITRVHIVPDPKSQFRVMFEALDKVDNAMMDTIMGRRVEAQSLIDFPYDLTPRDDNATPAPKGRASKNTKGRY